MKIRIYSKAEMEKQLEKGFEEETAVISFYDPESSEENYVPVDYSGQDIRLFQVGVRDIDMSSLKRCGMRYNDYFPEADTLAEFILHAVNDDCEIICQCDYGQSRSAACAAAILEHFEKKGVSVFADVKYLPNQMIYNKLMAALKRVHTKPTVHEVFCTMRKDRYYNYIERACKFCRCGEFENALDLLEILLQIVTSDMGENSMYSAYVYGFFAYAYRYAKRYDEAEKMYEKMLEIYDYHGQNRVLFRVYRNIARLHNAQNDAAEVVRISHLALENQLGYGDKVYTGRAKEMYGDALFYAKRYKEATDQWLGIDGVLSRQVLWKLSNAYNALGNTEKAAEYMNKNRMADKAHQRHLERLEKLKQEIESIKAEMGEV
ncbi:MAG: tetratricopeptide repeat protein [Oscillospiraceae bacterium]